MRTIRNQTFDEERALYGSADILVKDCAFDGPADGESAFKECRNIQVEHGFFNLRYPFWHDHGLKICNSEMTCLCRAALWYSDHIQITNTRLYGIKAPAGVQQSENVWLRRCFPGIWMVGAWYKDEGLHRRERIFYDAFYKSAFQQCADERQILLPVH